MLVWHVKRFHALATRRENHSEQARERALH